MKALNFLIQGQGPKGGNLNNPNQQPDARRTAFNATHDDQGRLLLHRKEDFVDTAVAGTQNEQPWHRMAAFMLLAGRTNSEIAMAAGVVPSTVSHLRAQRWFQELLATLSNEHGADLTGLLQSEAQDSLNVLIEMRDDTTLPARLRYQAAKDLFELAHGKATQKIVSSVSHTTHASPSEEMESIQQQLAALRSSATKELPAPTPEV